MNKLLLVMLGILVMPFVSADVEPSLCDDLNYKVERLSAYYYDEVDPEKAHLIKDKLILFQEQQINQECLDIKIESDFNPIILFSMIGLEVICIFILFGYDRY